jgi:hypothetical protein
MSWARIRLRGCAIEVDAGGARFALGFEAEVEAESRSGEI